MDKKKLEDLVERAEILLCQMKDSMKELEPVTKEIFGATFKYSPDENNWCPFSIGDYCFSEEAVIDIIRFWKDHIVSADIKVLLATL